MTGISDFAKKNLDNQGFGGLDDEAKSRYALPIRFSPGVATSLIVIGLVLQSPIWLGAVALIALSGALFPKGMILDLVYNLSIRHIFNAPPLPPTPKPRQFSYFLSTLWLTGSALAFYYGFPVLGFILGGVVVLAGATITSSLWCLGSWWYRLIFGYGGDE